MEQLEINKENFFEKTNAIFTEIPKMSENELFSMSEILLNKNTCKDFCQYSVFDGVTNRAEWVRCIEPIFEYDRETETFLFKKPDYIGGGKYQTEWVCDGDKLLQYKKGDEIEHENCKYKVIDICVEDNKFNEVGEIDFDLDSGDDFGLEDYHNKVVLQPLYCGSVYWYTSRGVFRYSDHWGYVSDCKWNIKPFKEYEIKESFSAIMNGIYYDVKDVRNVQDFALFITKKQEKVKMLGFCAWQDFKKKEVWE